VIKARAPVESSVKLIHRTSARLSSRLVDCLTLAGAGVSSTAVQLWEVRKGWSLEGRARNEMGEVPGGEYARG